MVEKEVQVQRVDRGNKRDVDRHAQVEVSIRYVVLDNSP
jgi:hypothetical protein